MKKKDRRCRFCIYFGTREHGGRTCWACGIQEHIENDPDYKTCHKFIEGNTEIKERNQKLLESLGYKGAKK